MTKRSVPVLIALLALALPVPALADHSLARGKRAIAAAERSYWHPLSHAGLRVGDCSHHRFVVTCTTTVLGELATLEGEAPQRAWLSYRDRATSRGVWLGTVPIAVRYVRL
jgi:hypothetical protein